MNFEAIIVGFASLAIIGIFHPVVIKWEYHFGAKSWWVFLAAGIIFLGLAFFSRGLLSYFLAMLGTTCLWCIIELKQQERRVEKGWFPKNPKRGGNDGGNGKDGEIK